jgi:hypothetical protein
MKTMPDKELVLQIFIILTSLLILFARFPSELSQAQSLCNDEPPLLDPNRPLREAWYPGVMVTTKVYETPDINNVNTIRDGFQAWNSPQNCSNVTFGEVSQVNGNYDENQPIPDNTIIVLRRQQNGQFVAQHKNFNSPNQYVIAGIVYIRYDSVGTRLKRTATHEIGHSLSLAEKTFGVTVPGGTIMGGSSTTITSCDWEALKKVYCPEMPDGCYEPPNNSLSTEENSREAEQRPEDPHECGPYYEWNPTTCECDIYTPPSSPIVIDTLGNGFHLTNNANGVRFDLNNDGDKEQLSWTSANSDDAWLALDRNANGGIDGGKELFGNFTPQPEPPAAEERNGFLALAEYDKPAKGGNNDGEISAQDAIFSRLRLWRDANHNGISETNELHSLDESELIKIELDYHESRGVDEFGNQFKYRAKVKDAQQTQISRWAWDVFLVTQP